jgi:hypothetical protein
MLSDPVTISLVGACATVSASLINAVLSYLSNQRGKRNENHLIETKDSLHALKVQTDGLQEKLIRVVGESEHAKGVKEGEGTAAKKDLPS